MSKINEEYVINRYNENQSTYSIAKELNTYPKKIERILKKNNIKIRSKSESQKLALKNGRTKHPTKGKVRTEEEKLNISEGVYRNWQNKSEEEKQKISEQAKKRWDDIPADKRREMQEAAGRALHATTKEGSKAEKYLYQKLKTEGLDVVLHKKGLVQGNFEIDLFLPEIKTIIEIDGPQHFLPLFGEDKLKEVIKLDSIKNGLLLGDGYCIIRVKYMLKGLSQKSARTLWELINSEIVKIQKKFPRKDKRFIELEIK
jgi:very-short-patch-repair endonuclease